MNPATLLLGPLAGPECRRAVARGWLIWVRTAAAFVIVGAMLCVLWYWWFARQGDPYYLPFELLRGTLATLEGMVLTLALILCPAVLAGSLAGEMERGSMGLLLTTRVGAREIVLGRLSGKLAQVSMIALAGAPAVLFVAALAGIRAPSLGALVLLPAAVGLGAGGLATAASAVARKGRNALLVVYVLLVLLLVAPAIYGTFAGRTWLRLDWLSPYAGLGPLCFEEDPGLTLLTSAVWGALGLVGTALACWRLRPVTLRLLGGDPRKGKGSRRWLVPAIGDRPMVWKELYIERVATLGWFGRLVGGVLVLWLGLGSLVLAAPAAYYRLVRPDALWSTAGSGITMASYFGSWLDGWYASTAIPVAILIQLALGLRAAVAISSERERGTWDAILTSPLEGGEIVRGKLAGSYFALRRVIVAALLAWTLTCLLGSGSWPQGLPWRDYLARVADVVVLGAFITAVGVRASLATPTATRAMSITVGLWLAAWITFAIVAAIAVSAIVFVIVMVQMSLVTAGVIRLGFGNPLAAGFFAWQPLTFGDAWKLVQLGLYLATTAALVGEMRLRFDRIAGRLAGGGVQVAVDRAIHGQPMAPVPLVERPRPPAPPASPDPLAETSAAATRPEPRGAVGVAPGDQRTE